MLTIATLRALSEARLEDARALLLAGRNEGSLYLCGYAVELALKAKICETLGWRWFPDTGKEAADYRSRSEPMTWKCCCICREYTSGLRSA